MFAPGISAGLIRPADLAGYRNKPVFISRSRYVSPRGDAVLDLMMATGGYPWVVVPVGERKRYMGALERGSISGALGAFAQFLGELVRWSD